MKYMLLFMSPATADAPERCTVEDWVLYEKALKDAGSGSPGTRCRT